MPVFGFLLDKATLQLILNSLLTKTDNPGRLEFFYQKLDKAFEAMVLFGF
jgi:hypothetical protein